MDSATLATKASSSSPSYISRLSSTPNPISSSRSLWRCYKESSKSLKCVQNSSSSSSSSSFPLKSKVRNPRCSAVTESPLGTSSELAECKLQRLVSEFESISEPIDRAKRLLHYDTLLPRFDESKCVLENRVMGCTAQVWLVASMDEFGSRFAADSDSEITRGFCSCLIWILDGAYLEDVLKLKTEDLAALNVGLQGGRAHSRVNTWHNVLISMQKRTKDLVAERQGKPVNDPFPSLVITADDIHPKGSYAEAQAKFLFPDELKVKELVDVLKEKKIGVVAHFYIDPEVQGILTTAQIWPHIHISDSLVMADMSVKMAEAGCKYITVLGVDFMSENVRAILDQAGFEKVSAGWCIQNVKRNHWLLFGRRCGNSCLYKLSRGSFKVSSFFACDLHKHFIRNKDIC